MNDGRIKKMQEKPNDPCNCGHRRSVHNEYFCRNCSYSPSTADTQFHDFIMDNLKFVEKEHDRKTK